MLRCGLMLSILAVAGAARADVEPGNWEVSITTSVPGTAGEIGPVVRTRCLSADDARDPSRVLGPGGGCEFTDRRDDGSVYTFAIVCGGQMPMRGVGSVRYGAASMEADLELSGDAGGQSFATRSHVSAHRVGPCKS